MGWLGGRSKRREPRMTDRDARLDMVVTNSVDPYLRDYDPPRELRFPQGYEIVEEARSGARAIKTMPAGTANIAAWRDVDGARYYMTDWSFNRLVKEGIRPNWLRPFGGSPAPAASSPPATTSGSTSATYRIAGLPEGERSARAREIGTTDDRFAH